jgi:hypothetical protein
MVMARAAVPSQNQHGFGAALKLSAEGRETAGFDVKISGGFWRGARCQE